jgi:hypothetical protein
MTCPDLRFSGIGADTVAADVGTDSGQAGTVLGEREATVGGASGISQVGVTLGACARIAQAGVTTLRRVSFKF